MPYIKDELRSRVDEQVIALVESLQDQSLDESEIEGVLNYTITSLLDGIKPFGRGWRYKYINRAIGVLECVKMEFYRRLVGPYEDVAKQKNGDINIYK